jgi:hypothetical protein
MFRTEHKVKSPTHGNLHCVPCGTFGKVLIAEHAWTAPGIFRSSAGVLVLVVGVFVVSLRGTRWKGSDYEMRSYRKHWPHLDIAFKTAKCSVRNAVDNFPYRPRALSTPKAILLHQSHLGPLSRGNWLRETHQLLHAEWFGPLLSLLVPRVSREIGEVPIRSKRD